VKTVNGGNDVASEKSAAVIVNVKPKVNASPDGVRPSYPAHVVNKLRGCNCPLCMWREAVGHIYVDERSQYAIIRPYGNLCGIGKIGVRLSEGEQEAKAI